MCELVVSKEALLRSIVCLCFRSRRVADRVAPPSLRRQRYLEEPSSACGFRFRLTCNTQLLAALASREVTFLLLRHTLEVRQAASSRRLEIQAKPKMDSIADFAHCVFRIHMRSFALLSVFKTNDLALQGAPPAPLCLQAIPCSRIPLWRGQLRPNLLRRPLDPASWMENVLRSRLRFSKSQRNFGSTVSKMMS